MIVKLLRGVFFDKFKEDIFNEIKLFRRELLMI